MTKRCGWCKGEPVCKDMGNAYRCPSCEKLYPKPVGGNSLIELFELPKKEFIPTPKPVEEPKKRGRKPKHEAKVFRFVDAVAENAVTPKTMTWLKEQLSLKITCACCKAPLKPTEPAWSYQGKWDHACS